MTTREDFARALLAAPVVQTARIPSTEQNVLALVAVMSGENTTAENNPCATTWHMPGATPFNTIGTNGGGVVHVWNFATEADGVDATVSTLLETDHEGALVYAGIVEALRTGTDARAVCEAWVLSPWGTKDAVAALEAVQANPTAYYAHPIGTEAAPPEQPPAPPAGTPPEQPAPPAGPQEVDVQLPVLSVTSPGPGESLGVVKTAQAKLALLGFGGHLGPTGADGKFGPLTENAVRVFQESKGLAADGIIGAATWPALIDA